MEVLVPVDDPDSAREIVEHSIREYPDASVTVLHVTPLNAVHGMGGMYMGGAVIDAQQRYADELLATATEIAAAQGGSVTTRTVIGSPVREIVAYAEESDTDHIVIGGCDRSSVLRLLLGNVTEGVVRGSAVPVTVVN